MRIKIHNGTVSHGEQSLCGSCRHATITRGRTLDEEIVRCELRPMSTVFIRFKVTECSAYMDARLPSYAQLLEQAWILRPGKGRRPAGFVRSSELPEDELCEVMTDLPEFGVSRVGPAELQLAPSRSGGVTSTPELLAGVGNRELA